MNNSSVEGQIFFGGPGGNFTPLINIGGKTIIFKGGNRVDSIQIGDTRYGGTGGNKSGTAILPSDASMTIYKLQTNNTLCINYIEANVNGTDVKIGTETTKATTLNVNIKAVLSGINSGEFVDSLQFNIVQ